MGSRLRQASAFSEQIDGLGLGANVELFIHRVDVGADGVGTDGEFMGNFLVAATPRQGFQNFLFPQSEPGLQQAGLLGWCLDEAGQEPTGNGTGHG